MKPNEFKKFQARDPYCIHCGIGVPYLVPHHRANRGMGGSKLRDNPSNILLVCALLNGAMEQQSQVAEDARRYGWKLESWQDPAIVPVYDAMTGFTYRLKDDYSKEPI
jgi:hypothetical protein